MSSIEHLETRILDLPPSCVEFDPRNPQYAVIGTYNLENSGSQEGEKKSQERNGSLILIQVNGNKLELLQTLPTPSAILDIHFSKQPDTSMFGVATSTGSISIYKLTFSANVAATMVHVNTIQFFPEDVLITAFSWHPDGRTLGMALSTGQICLGRFPTSNVDAHTESSADVMVHDLEAWTLAFIPDGSGILSGGDDCALRFNELPQNPMAFYRKPPWTDKKIHGAGVTAILPIHWDETSMLVITGSYDDHIRLLHVPPTGRPQVLSEANLGGGVWRLKALDIKRPSHPNTSNPPPSETTLLASCMHAGPHIIQLHNNKDKQWSFAIVAKFDNKHKSMNYGSDAHPLLNHEGKRSFLTTSFYDCLLCLWRARNS